MRTNRQAHLDRQIVRGLIACGDYLMPEQTLFEQLGVAIAPPLKRAEFDDAVRHLEAEKRIRILDTETGRKLRVTDLGRDWLEQQLTGG